MHPVIDHLAVVAHGEPALAAQQLELVRGGGDGQPQDMRYVTDTQFAMGECEQYLQAGLIAQQLIHLGKLQQRLFLLRQIGLDPDDLLLVEAGDVADRTVNDFGGRHSE